MGGAKGQAGGVRDRGRRAKGTEVGGAESRWGWKVGGRPKGSMRTGSGGEGAERRGHHGVMGGFGVQEHPLPEI